MNRKLAIISTLILVAAAALVAANQFQHRQAAAAAKAALPAKTAAAGLIAAAGRVEPLSEEIKIGAELNGKLKSVSVEEGDHVRKGQVIAVLENADFAARVALAKAELAQKEAAALRATNGSRPEERREAEQSVLEAKAVLDNAQSELNRRTVLFNSGDIARSNFEITEREMQVAKARYETAVQRQKVAYSATRGEDLAGARAEVERARAQLAESEAMLNKTFVRSPIDGIVLRKHLKTGESVSDQSANVIVTLGDDSRLRVRADVDESDVGRVHNGQSAYVTAEAYGNRRFRGTVVRVGQILGRKNVRTDAPSERVDTKILETLIELDAGVRLPAGLRVDTFIETR